MGGLAVWILFCVVADFASGTGLSGCSFKVYRPGRLDDPLDSILDCFLGLTAGSEWLGFLGNFLDPPLVCSFGSNFGRSCLGFSDGCLDSLLDFPMETTAGSDWMGFLEEPFDPFLECSFGSKFGRDWLGFSDDFPDSAVIVLLISFASFLAGLRGLDSEIGTGILERGAMFLLLGVVFSSCGTTFVLRRKGQAFGQSFLQGMGMQDAGPVTLLVGILLGLMRHWLPF